MGRSIGITGDNRPLNESGIRRIRGLYRPTNRNGMVAEHYPRLGFEKATGSQEDGTYWEIAVDKIPDVDVIGELDIDFS